MAEPSTPEIPKRTRLSEAKASSSITKLAASVMLGLKETVLSTVSREGTKPTTKPTNSSENPDEDHDTDVTEEEELHEKSFDGDTEAEDPQNTSREEATSRRSEGPSATELLLKASESVESKGSQSKKIVKAKTDIISDDKGFVQRSKAFDALIQKRSKDFMMAMYSSELQDAQVDQLLSQLMEVEPRTRFLKMIGKKSFRVMCPIETRNAIGRTLQARAVKMFKEIKASLPPENSKEAATHPQDYRLSDIIVIAGKIADGTGHEGNQRLINMIFRSGPEYAAASYPEKAKIAEKIVKLVTESPPLPGRFLQPEWRTGKWVFFPLPKAVNMIHRCLEWAAIRSLTFPFASSRDQIPSGTNGRNRDNQARGLPPTGRGESSSAADGAVLPAAGQNKRPSLSAIGDSEGEDDPSVGAAKDDAVTNDDVVDTDEMSDGESSSLNGEGARSDEPGETVNPKATFGDVFSEVRPNDILRGRGDSIYSHEGNKLFRNDIREFSEAYALATNKRKKREIVDAVLGRVNTRGGRFLQEEGKSWRQSDWEDARKKTGQALREGAAELRQKMGVGLDTVAGSSSDKEKHKLKLARGEAPGAPGNLSASDPALASSPESDDEMPSADLSYPGIVTPRPTDVLSGRGSKIKAHPGNAVYRQLIQENKVGYSLATSEAEKARLIRVVIQAIQNQDPPGRFLFQDKSKNWVEQPEERWIRKTSQALREGAPQIRLTHGGNPEKMRVRRTTKRKIETIADLAEFSETTAQNESGDVEHLSDDASKRPRIETPASKKPGGKPPAVDRSPGLMEVAALLGGLGQRIRGDGSNNSE